jgi:hypothetical protein
MTLGPLFVIITRTGLGRKCNIYIKLTKDRENGEVEFEYEQGKSGEDVKGVGGEGRR